MGYIFFNFINFFKPKKFPLECMPVYLETFVNIEMANVTHLKGSRCTHAAVCSSFKAVRDGKITL